MTYWTRFDQGVREDELICPSEHADKSTLVGETEGKEAAENVVVFTPSSLKDDSDHVLITAPSDPSDKEGHTHEQMKQGRKISSPLHP